MVSPDPDSDVRLYDVDFSEEHEQLFQRIRQRHAELFDPPESEEWIHGPTPEYLSMMMMSPGEIEAVVEVVVDVWEADALDVDDARYAEFLDGFEIDPVPQSSVPESLKDY